MRNIWTIIKNCRKRNMIVIVICIGLGLLMGYEQKILGMDYNDDFSKMSIALITSEENVLTKNMTDYLTEQIGMDVTVGNSYETYTDDLLNRELSAIIELSDGYYTQCISMKKALPVQTTTIDNYENEAYIKSYLDAYLQSLDLIFQSANGDQKAAEQMISNLKPQAIEAIGADQSIRDQSANYSGFTLTVGFYLNFVWILGIFLGMVILTDRVDGTFMRIQGSSIKGYQYMLGTALYYNLVGALTPICFLTYLKIQGVEFGFSYGHAFLLMMLMQFIVIGIAAILSLLINSKIGIVIGVYVFGAFAAILGGAYFDIGGITGALAKVIRMTPTYWFMDCVRQFQNTKGFQPGFHLLILSLFALLSCLIAGTLFSRQMEEHE